LLCESRCRRVRRVVRRHHRPGRASKSTSGSSRDAAVNLHDTRGRSRTRMGGVSDEFDRGRWHHEWHGAWRSAFRRGVPLLPAQQSRFTVTYRYSRFSGWTARGRIRRLVRGLEAQGFAVMVETTSRGESVTRHSAAPRSSRARHAVAWPTAEDDPRAVMAVLLAERGDADDPGAGGAVREPRHPPPTTGSGAASADAP
jgi:hypothetical protein